MAIIGSAEVEIVPSVRSLSRKVEQKIKSEASKLGDDIGETLGDRIADKMGDSIPDGIQKSGRKAKAQAEKVGEDVGQTIRKRIDSALKSLPNVKIDADSKGADAKISEIRKNLETLGKNVGLGLDDKGAKVGIEAIREQLNRLSHDSASIAVKLDAKKALAELAVLDKEIDSVSDGKKLTRLQRMNKQFDSLGEHAYNSNRNLRALAITTAAILSPGIIPIAEAASAGILAIGGAFAAAGTASVAFGLVSVASWKKISDAQKEAEKGNFDAFNSLTKNEKIASLALNNLKVSWDQVSTSLEPITLPIETRGLDILRQNLPKLRPLVLAAADGMDYFLDKTDAAFKGDTVRGFISFVQRQASPAMRSFTDLAGGVGSGLASALQQTEKYLPGVDKGISSLGDHIAAFGKSDELGNFLAHAADEAPAVISFLQELGRTVGTLLAQLEPVGEDVMQIATDALPQLSDGFKIVGDVIKPVTGFLADHSTIVGALAASYGTIKALKIADTFAGIGVNLAKMVALNPEIAALAAGIGLITYAIANDSKAYDAASKSVDDFYKKQQSGVDAFKPDSFRKAENAVLDYADAAGKAFDKDPSEGNLAKYNLAIEQMPGNLVKLNAAQEGASRGIKSLSINFGQGTKDISGLAKAAGISSNDIIQYGEDFNELQRRLSTGADLGNLPAKVSKEFDGLTNKINDYTTKSKNATPANEQLNASFQTLASNIASPTERLQALTAALGIYSAQATGTLVSQATAYQSIDTTVTSLKKANLGQIIHNDLGRANSDTLTAAQNLGSLRSAMDANVEAFAKGKVSAKQLITTSNDLKKSFIDQATAAGVPRKQAQALANTYLTIPKNVTTKFAQHGADDVKNKANGIADTTARIDGKTYQVHFKEDGSVVVEGATERIQKKAEAYAKEYTAYIKQNGADDVASKSDYVTGRLNGIPKNVAIQIDAHDNATTVIDGLARLNGRVISTQYVDITTRNNTTGHVDTQRATSRADGGPITGSGGPRQDNIPIWASNGEYVVNAAATKRNRALLESINSNKFADGGMVGFASGGAVNAKAIDDLLRQLIASTSRGVRNQTSGSRVGTAFAFQANASIAAFNKQIDNEISVISKSNDRLKEIADRRKTLMADIASNPKDKKLIARDTAQLQGLERDRTKALDAIGGSKAQIAQLRRSRNSITGFLTQENRDFQKIANQRQAILNKAAEANDYGTGIRQNVQSSSGLLSIGDASGSRQIIAMFRKKVQAAKAFNSNVRLLAKRGVSRQILSEMIEAGPDGAGEYAQQLAHAPGYDLKTLNSLQGQLNTAAGNTARTGVGLKYGMQDLGKSFVQSLNSKATGLEKVMDRMADRFAATLKRKLNSASGAQRRANGGLLSGPGSGTSDSIPVDASDGEFIVNARSTSAWLPVLKAINGNASTPGSQQYSNGGVVAAHGSTTTIINKVLLDGKVVAQSVNEYNKGINSRIGVR